MKRTSIVFLQAATVLIGVGALALMLWFPHIEGRNAHATFWDVYLKDPFLAYAYLSSIPFFVALYQAFKLLRYIGRNEVFSQRSVNTLRTIKKCGVLMMCAVAGAALGILMIESDDRAGGIALCIVVGSVSLAVTVAATKFERLLK